MTTENEIFEKNSRSRPTSFLDSDQPRILDTRQRPCFHAARNRIILPDVYCEPHFSRVIFRTTKPYGPNGISETNFRRGRVPRRHRGKGVNRGQIMISIPRRTRRLYDVYDTKRRWRSFEPLLSNNFRFRVPVSLVRACIND